MLHVNRTIDLSSTGAVGLDLDHTLVVYDDQRVNEIAARETRSFLVDEFGYPGSIQDRPFVHAHMTRGLQIDMATGHVTKCDPSLSILRAVRGEEWLGSDRISQLNQVEAEPHRFHTLHSPFDITTGIVFNDILAQDECPTDFPAICSDVRRMLDRSHTTGLLKRRIIERVHECARIDPAALEFVEAMRAQGKKVFILTNSDRSYTETILDRLAPNWRELFDVVVTSANKPLFFTTPMPTVDFQQVAGTTILTAAALPQLESVLGVSGERILYVGDNAASDVHAAAVAGWKAIMVLPELTESVTAWGSPFFEGDRITWYMDMILDAGDAVVAGVGDLLEGAEAMLLTTQSHPLPRAWQSHAGRKMSY